MTGGGRREPQRSSSERSLQRKDLKPRQETEMNGIPAELQIFKDTTVNGIVLKANGGAISKTSVDAIAALTPDKLKELRKAVIAWRLSHNLASSAVSISLDICEAGICLQVYADNVMANTIPGCWHELFGHTDDERMVTIEELNELLAPPSEG